jgi:hypothetical protein
MAATFMNWVNLQSNRNHPAEVEKLSAFLD